MSGCWKNGMDRLVWSRVTTNLKFEKQMQYLPSTIKQSMIIYYYTYTWHFTNLNWQTYVPTYQSILKRFHSSIKKCLHPLTVTLDTLLTLSPRQQLVYCCFYRFANYGQCIQIELYNIWSLWLTSFTLHNFSKFIYVVCVLICHSFLWPTNISSYGHTTFCLFIY